MQKPIRDVHVNQSCLNVDMGMEPHSESKSMELKPWSYRVQVGTSVKEKSVGEAVKGRRRKVNEIFVEREGLMREVAMGIAAEQVVKEEEEIVMSK